VLNLGFAVIELIGGLWTGSVAILSDAIHDMGDAFALGLALFFERLAGRDSNSRFSYGYRRMSLLSAVFTCAFLLGGSVLVLMQAVPKLMNPEMPNLDGMFGFAFLGIAVNGFAAYKMTRGKTMSEKAVFWHLMEDVLGWVAILIGTVVMKIWDLPIIDPILCLLVSGVIFWRVAKTLYETSQLFLQASPQGIDLAALRKDIEALDGVRGTHDAHLWSLDGESHVLTLHVVVSESVDMVASERIKAGIRKLTSSKGKIHLTVEVESEATHCPAIDCVKS
jgi:cobalt-zinc-cadmium efflux system protein